MNQARMNDVARQFANVFAAIFQVYASYTVGSSVGVIAQEYRSPILPRHVRHLGANLHPLRSLRAVPGASCSATEPGLPRDCWWTVGAFLANGGWSYAYTNRQFVLAQAIIFAGFVFAGGSYLRFARAVPAARATQIDNWLIGPTLGLLFGWLTAASIVGLAGRSSPRGLPRPARARRSGMRLSCS